MVSVMSRKWSEIQHAPFLVFGKRLGPTSQMRTWICFLDFLWGSVLKFKQFFCGRKDIKRKQTFWSGSFLGWPGGCHVSWDLSSTELLVGDWDPPDNRHRHSSEASFVGSSVDMWQIQNRDEVNVIESPVMNLGRVELSVFNSNDCTLVYFCSILSLLFSLEAIAKYVRFPSMDCS